MKLAWDHTRIILALFFFRVFGGMLECIWFISMWKIFFLSGKLPVYTRLLKVWDLQNWIGCSRKFNIMKYGLTHWTFLPKRPCSFWSAPRITTYRLTQFSEYFVSYSQLVRFDSSLWFTDFLCWTSEATILGADQNEHGLWDEIIVPNYKMGAFKLMTVIL